MDVIPIYFVTWGNSSLLDRDTEGQSQHIFLSLLLPGHWYRILLEPNA